MLKKRDAAKDSIVDRRLETLTGGVDELGWEDSLANPANPYGLPSAHPFQPQIPSQGSRGQNRDWPPQCRSPRGPVYFRRSRSPVGCQARFPRRRPPSCRMDPL